MFNKKVTVLMPVYNGEDYVKGAIQSVLNQTYEDFDLVVINDGSTDSSENIIKSFNDARIKYVPNEKNMGLIKTLNRGFDLINGEYIIRMDADDICLPERFEKQVTFMDNNLAIAIAGTSVKKFSDTEQYRQEYVKSNSEDLKTQLLFGSPLRHPSVIIRNAVIKKENYHYEEKLNTVEDYGLWQEISEKYPLANLKEPLLEYRINEMGITQQADKKISFRDSQHKIIYRRIFKSLGLEVSEVELQLYREFLTHRILFSKDVLETLKQLLETIKYSLTSSEYNIELFEGYLKRFFTDICLKNNISHSEWKACYRDYFRNLFLWTITDDLKYIGKRVRK